MSYPVFSTATWTLDGVSFNTGPDERGFAYLVQKSAGWAGSAPARPDQADRPSANGAYRASNYYAPRVVELDGVAECSNWADRDALSDSLAGLCPDPDTLYPLVRVERTRTLRLMGERVGKVEVTELPDGYSVAFNIQLVASEPRKFSTLVQQAQTTIAQAALLGVEWGGPAAVTGAEWGGPAAVTGVVWQAGAGTSGVVDLTNDGTSPTPILFTITGPTSGTLPMPTITDTRGNVLQYNGSLSAGDVLTIDTATGLCLLNGGSVGGQFSRSDFFEIPARTTLSVGFSASGPADTASLLAQWSAAY
jgi:hypothetical protein